MLGRHLLLAHAVWIDDDETERLLQSGPWCLLPLGLPPSRSGVTQAGRQGELIRRGGRVALGWHSVNAADLPDIHRAAALAVGLARDMAMDTASVTAATGLDLATIRGAEAVGMSDRIGSIEPGKQADLVVHQTTGSSWRRVGRSDLKLIWGTDGRFMRDVLVQGRIVLRRGRSTLGDEAGLAAHARWAQAALLRRAGL